MKKSQIKKTIKEEIISLLSENEGTQPKIGDSIKIPNDLTTDPYDKKGKTGKIVYINPKFDTVVIEFSDKLGLYDASVVGFDNVKETTMVDKDTDPNDVEGLNPNTVKSAVELSKKSSKPVTIAEEDDDWYNSDNEFDVDEKEPTAKDLKKEPITKIASKLAETQKEMKSIVAKYKVASDAEKPKYVERLKQLTKIKKELEKLL